MSIIGPAILGVAGPTYEDFRRRYYEDDTWSLPNYITDARRQHTPGQPRTTQSSDNTPAKVPYMDVKPQHPFSVAFTSDYDDVDIG